VVVNKSSSAELVEGGVAGSVDIITRKPLDFSQPFTVQASAGAVYASLPSKTDGQYTAMGAWKNSDNNFGVMLQLFSETRHLRRDGNEVLGYDTIAPGSAIATAHPDLSGVQYPTDIGAALFEQKRERNGGLLDIEFKPADNVTLDLTGFSSKLTASNVNYNYLLWSTHIVGSGAGQAPNPGYVVSNNTLVNATFAPVAGTAYGVYDQISRPDEVATANFVNLDANWDASDRLSFLGQVGYSWGDGKTPTQNVSETNPGIGTGASYSLNGLSTGPSYNLGATNNTTPTPGGVPVTFAWIFGDQNIDVKDREEWAKIDSNFKVDDGAWKDLKFGVRYERHGRTSADVIGQGPLPPGESTDAYPTTYSNYPSNYTNFGGVMPTGVWFWTPAQLAAYNSSVNVNRNPATRLDWNSMFEVHEFDSAAFVQADFKGDRWAANAGLRYVHTVEHVLQYVGTAATNPDSHYSDFGVFTGQETDNSYNDVLPSANFRFDVTQNLLARFAVAETMTRADYSALAGFTTLSGTPALPSPGNPSGTVGGGTGGNPDLKPIRSTNVDAGLEWYFAPKSLLSATLFYMELRNYVSYGTVNKNLFSFTSLYPNGALLPYELTIPINAKGRVEGTELAYQQAFTENFGFIGNYTYADGKQTSDLTSSDDRLVGTSKHTYNVQGYFENKMFSFRIAYTWRSAFYSGLDRNTAFTQDKIGDLSASLAYNITPNFSLTLDGQNLNNPTLRYYALNEEQPRAFYKNGSQYYLNVRFKM
jgi:iron complex outermembrane recepter protein